MLIKYAILSITIPAEVYTCVAPSKMIAGAFGQTSGVHQAVRSHIRYCSFILLVHREQQDVDHSRLMPETGYWKPCFTSVMAVMLGNMLTVRQVQLFWHVSLQRKQWL
jgi:hypothetical protein